MILKIITTAIKELRLLIRDRTGLIVLFVMPAILVVVMTLVQENVLQLTGQKGTHLLYLDFDKGSVSKELLSQLKKGPLEIVHLDTNQTGAADVQALVTNGTYQVGVVIAKGTSAQFEETAARLFDQDSTEPTPVRIFFDPGILPSLRSGLRVQIEAALHTITIQKLIKHMEKKLEPLLAISGPAQTGLGQDSGLQSLLNQPLLTLQTEPNKSNGQTKPYNPVQQNVPAWALFGMFFIAIPIAGGLLKERKTGIWIRLMSLPVSPLVLISGKIVAYTAVCFCQFLLIFLVGSTLFPTIGLPPFTLAAPVTSILLIILLSGLAACGYGVLLGILCNTYEQVSALGATTIVIAAAVGGVMVPVYAMPQLMQDFSIVSPLNWGLNSFQGLMVRANDFSSIVDDLGRLLLFFLATISFGCWRLRRMQE